MWRPSSSQRCIDWVGIAIPTLNDSSPLLSAAGCASSSFEDPAPSPAQAVSARANVKPVAATAKPLRIFTFAPLRNYFWTEVWFTSDEVWGLCFWDAAAALQSRADLSACLRRSKHVKTGSLGRDRKSVV